MRHITPFINGNWLPAGDRQREDVLNPATGTAVAQIAHASAADLDAALEAAKAGFRTWRATPAIERERIMQAAVAIIRSRKEAIAQLITEEQGKPIAEARGEVDAAADMVSWLAGEARHLYGRVIPGRQPGLTQTVVFEPIGPSLALTPWNFPAISPARKIGGALGAGCSLIIKPSEEVPSACVEMVKAFVEAGLPAGVLNLVCGVPDTISTHLIRSSVIRKVSFTGSVPVGRHLAKLCAEGPKPVTMELGGHAPALVFDDVDPTEVAAFCAAMKFRNAGQICTSPTRFLVHESGYAAFTKRFAECADALVVGDGAHPETAMGPVVNSRRVSALRALVEDARQRGATLETRRTEIAGASAGFYFPPTVLTDVPADARMMAEEPFGPVALIQPFKTTDEALELANRLPFGLAAYAFTTTSKIADAVSAGLEAGAIGINTFAITAPEAPFGGVKDSGYGREGGYEGVEAFCVKKLVART
ncbi:NAD-dependent succinate-semialdehyde dehydrogenase [Burkholderia sp. WAC0059]|uniref:NAD-dependent succinate-semialdehyde dehydrogenase n=1 Tax=Burkholderia sp. WAC0059 TaxID=2066022 RepID=UPI000C7ED76E|nr:NAD-dependent succinate-semialdehyde dehydrogenase [Burkholderia sp. WAC0059]PLZ03178.1 NAD-dependent succinate-semialdehyde dehydrogenase [Burkholderia sp. WAC0059]